MVGKREASALTDASSKFSELLQRFFNSNSHGNGHTDHGPRARPPPVAETGRAQRVPRSAESESVLTDEVFAGYCKRDIRNLLADCHLTTTWSVKKRHLR